MELTLPQELLQIVIPLATIVVTAFTSWALAWASAYIKSKTENETVGFAFDRAQVIIKDVVAKVNQSVKEAGADGKISKEEATTIKAVAIASINKQMPGAVKDVLELAVGDLQDWIDTQIESSVYYFKNGNTG
jgi:hypothetical protein